MSDYYVHPQGICESTDVGDGTRVWAFAHVLAGARLGSQVTVCDHVFVENDVVIGDRVTIKSGVQVWDGIELGDDVFVGPNVTFTNDPFPRNKQYPETFSRTVIESGASIGGGAVILPGVRVGHSAMVGAGAVVTRDVPPFAIVTGNPAAITGYNDTAGRKLAPHATGDVPVGAAGTATRRQIRLSHAHDMRGSLVVTEFARDLPFEPARFFMVYDVPSRDVRGEHAHRTCEQVLVCLRGSVRAVVDDGETREEYVLDSPEVGLHMPAMTWGTQYAYSPDAILGVFASLPYDENDYIRDYSTFVAEVSSKG